MAESINPPGWILFLLWPFKGESCYPHIVGDLNEEFYQRVTEKGELAAYRWFYREVVRNSISLVFRWVTIPIIVVPLVCCLIPVIFKSVPRELSISLHNWLINSPKYFLGSSSLLWADLFLGILLGLGILGLLSGIISSLVLRGHERSVRVVFGVCCLISIGLTYYFYGRWNLLFDGSEPLEYRILGKGAFYFKPLWVFTFIWIGNIWTERLNHKRQVA